MPCEVLKDKDGHVMFIKCGHSRGPKRHCKFCRRDYYGGKLCDFPVGNGRTCDAQMCEDCARTLGRGAVQIGGGMQRLNDSIDVCPIHREQAILCGGELTGKEAK